MFLAKSDRPQIEINTQSPKILIVKMWALGDILLATPLLRALKDGFPECKITWLADKDYAPALRVNPLIDDLIEFDSKAWRTHFRYGRIFAYLGMSLRLVRDLQKRNFDIVINLTAEKWWALWFNRAKVKIGLFPRERPGLMGRAYDVAIPRTFNPRLHNSEHYCLPAIALGLPKTTDLRIVMGVSDSDRTVVQQMLDASDGYDPSKPLIVLHPGTSQVTKCWFPERFAGLIDSLPNFNCVLTGSRGELELCEKIAGMAKSKTVVAARVGFTLGQTTALIERAAAVMTGDTVILHIASALDIPLVGIYGSTRPQDNSPQSGRSRLLFDDSVPCAPCFKSSCRMTGDEHMSCMKGVSVRMVLDSLAEMGVGYSLSKS